jgi:hypothetical protein
VRLLAAELDLRPTKQRGQNFVIDANTVRRIVREAGVGPDDTVVEVGPGLGSLTLALLEVAGRVVAVEVDERLATRLPATNAAYAPGQVDRFEVVLGDAMRPESTFGAGQKTLRPTEPARRTSANHAALTEGTPYTLEPGPAASRSATSACTITRPRSREGSRVSMCSSTGTDTL